MPIFRNDKDNILKIERLCKVLNRLENIKVYN